jgi:hypothetical protein
VTNNTNPETPTYHTNESRLLESSLMPTIDGSYISS